MYFNAFTYLFSAGTIWKLTTKEKERSKIKGMAVVLTDIKEGMKYIFHDVRLIILIFFGTIFWFAGISFYMAISDFAGRVWRFTSLTPLGLVFTLLGGGLLIGSVMAGKYGNRVKRNMLYTGSIWMLAFGIMAFSLIESYTVLRALYLLSGLQAGHSLPPLMQISRRSLPTG